MDFGLKGKVAWVTAASRGLGLATAMALGREGARLAICSRDAAAIDQAARRIRDASGAEVWSAPADVSRAEDVERFANGALKRFGRADVLVVNTGGPPPGRFAELDDGAWQAAFDLLLLSAIRLTRAAIPSMRERGAGRIIYLTSLAVKQPLENLILSNSLRAAVTGLAKTLSRELGPEGILVSCVAPGTIYTERIEQLNADRAARTGRPVDEVRRAAESAIPVRRYGTPEEFANVVAFLASAPASYVSGVTLQVDGGSGSGLL